MHERFIEFCKDGMFFEYILTSMYNFFLREGDLCLDGGANEGYHTVKMSRKVGKTGKVISVEPIPDMATKLRAGKYAFDNVFVVENALSNDRGSSNFNHCIDRSTLSGLAQKSATHSYRNEIITVQNTLIDDLRGYGSIRMVKLDLEGGEYNALLGASHLLEEEKPLILFEHSAWEGQKLYGYSNSDYYSYLCGFGYKIYDFLGNWINEEKFNKPDVWYFIGINFDDRSHQSVAENFPAFIVDAAQRMLTYKHAEFCF